PERRNVLRAEAPRSVREEETTRLEACFVARVEERLLAQSILGRGAPGGTRVGRRVLGRHALTDGPRAVSGIEHGNRVRRVGPRERCRRNFHREWRCVGTRPRRAYAAEGLERSAEPLVLVCEPRAERRMKLLRNVECDATERRDTGRRETRMLNGKVEFVVRAGEKLAV